MNGTKKRTESLRVWGCRLCSPAEMPRCSLASRIFLRDQCLWKLEEDTGEEEIKLQSRSNKAPASHPQLGALDKKGLLQAWGLKMVGPLYPPHNQSLDEVPQEGSALGQVGPLY